MIVLAVTLIVTALGFSQNDMVKFQANITNKNGESIFIKNNNVIVKELKADKTGIAYVNVLDWKKAENNCMVSFCFVLIMIPFMLIGWVAILFLGLGILSYTPLMACIAFLVMCYRIVLELRDNKYYLQLSSF